MALILKHMPELVVAQALVDAGHATLFGAVVGEWPIVVNYDVDIPDNLLSVYGTNPLTHHRVQLDGEEVREEGIQLRIRARTPDVCAVKAWALFTYISQTLYQQTVSITEAPATTYYLQSMRCTSGPVPISPRNKPVSERTIYVINYLVSFVEEF